MLPIEGIEKAIKNYKNDKRKNPPISYILCWLEMAQIAEKEMIMKAWSDGYKKREQSSFGNEVDNQSDYYDSLIAGF